MGNQKLVWYLGLILVLVAAFMVFYYLGTKTGFDRTDALAPLKGTGNNPPQCSDHLDNDKDGYCDYKTRSSYCNDGSILGDNDCLSKSGLIEGCNPTTEACDGKDNDCDSLIDNGNICFTNYYCDNDKDGAINKIIDGNCSTYNCVPVGCSKTQGTDCDDKNYSIYLGAKEFCDSADNDCDGLVDENCFVELCTELFPGINDKTADRANIVFVGSGYPDFNVFVNQVMAVTDYYGNVSSVGPGLMELPVYRDNKAKFNFWYVNKNYPLPQITSCTQCGNADSLNYCKGLANVRKLNLCYTSFRGCAYSGGDSYIAATGSYAGSWPFVPDHEFQHQFPALRDEYVETGLGDRPATPNCAPDLATAQKWWGSLVGQAGTDGKPVGYFDGCSYVTGNYRPIDNDMMRSWVFNLGLVNEKHIASVLSSFSGVPAAVYANTIEITLQGNPDDLNSYEVVEVKKADFSNEVRIEKQKKNSLRITAGAKQFLQNFDVYDYLITEDFNSSQNIKLVNYETIPKPTVTVFVSTKDFSLDSRTKKLGGTEFSIVLEKEGKDIKEISFEKIKDKIK